MPVYQYEGQHYDLPDGLSNEQAIAKIKTHLGQKEQDNTGEKSLGLVEAGLSTVAGLPSQIAGGLYGLGKLMSGQGIDAAGNAVKDAEEWNFGAGKYTPSTAAGKRYSENLGEALNKPVEWAGDAGGFLGRQVGNEALGRLAGELPVATAMALIDPLIAGKGAKALIDRAGKPKVDRPTVSNIESALETPVTPEPAMAPKEQTPIYVDRAGEASVGQMDLGTRLARERAEQTMLEQLDEQYNAQRNADFLNAEQGELFGNPDLFELQRDGEMAARDPAKVITEQRDLFEPYTNSHREFDQFGNERKALTFDEYKSTVDNLSAEQTTRFQKPEDLVEGYKNYLESTDANQGGLFDSPTRQNAFQEAIYQDTVPQRVADHPFVKNLSDRVAKQEALITKMNGDPKMLPTQIARAERELAGMQEKLDTVSTNVETALRNREQLPKSLKEFNARTRGQGGGVLFDWGSTKNEQMLKKVPGLKEGIRNLLPDTRTVEQFKAQEANTADVSQNLVQKGFNYLTKGGVYQTMKTNNPLIKRVVDRFLEADNQAKALTGQLVHDYYAPSARAMNSKEKADVWAAMMLAEKAQKPLTPEMMREAGFNEKQTKFAKIHQEVMEPMYQKLSEAMKAAGLEPVSQRVAYVAAKARGDFRRFVYDGNGEIVGVLGANTRIGLKRDIERLQKVRPDYKIGEERFYGGTQARNGTEAGFNQMLEFLSQNDPRLKEFVDIVNEMGREDAFNYMNAKSHTMQKKGIWGTEGKKLFATAEQNAIEGMEAQVRYAETMIKWGELSKAVDDMKPFMDKDNGIDMPNAKAYLKDYTDNALGRNPTELGRALENLGAAFGKATGAGVTIPTKITSGAKTIVNGLLLGWGNIPFLVTNIVQPFKAMPEMKAWLESKGAKTNFDLGTGYSYLARATVDMMKERSGKPLDPVIKGALDYAKANHVYSSDLFEAGNSVKRDAEYVWNKGTQAGAAEIEQVTRKSVYLASVKLLSDNNITPKDGLYQAARRVTDMAMNNYSHVEAPMMYNATGGAGRMAYNLMSFKHNELSRLAMFARELGRDKSAKPLLVALGSQVAFAGVLGTIGYAEADSLVKLISEMMGKPTSLTKMLLDSDVSDNLKFGMFNAAGVNMSGRLGLGQVVNTESPRDLMFPGASKLTDMATAGAKAITSPSEFNTKNAIRAFSPNSLVGLEDRAWFSGQDGNGNELSMNRNKVEANAVRNEDDKLWKTLGAMGVNESKQKTIAYENRRIDKLLQDKRGDVIDSLAKTYFTSGNVDNKLVKKYLELQGDPNTLAQDLQNIAIKQKVPSYKLDLLKNATSQSLTAMHRLNRMTGKE